ncbi:MAG: DUF1851 domain-containing protein [Polyangiaceae bacterium]
MSLDSLSYALFTDDFKKKKTRYAATSAALLTLYRKRVSAEFAEMMKAEGLCSYADGLFTTVDTKQYKGVLKEFGLPSDSLVLLKNAFADLFYFDGFECRILYTSHNESYSFAGGDAVKYFFTFQLTDASFQRKNFKKRLFQQALKQHGPLGPDESYGFVPALPLGGKEVVTQIQKVKTLEYLDLLAQSFA